MFVTGGTMVGGRVTPAKSTARNRHSRRDRHIVSSRWTSLRFRPARRIGSRKLPVRITYYMREGHQT
jgi:hypothetical protein